jgi:nitrogen regulatory protein PII
VSNSPAETSGEIVLAVVYTDQVDTVLTEIVRAAELNEKGRGIAFVIRVEKIVGVAHFMRLPGAE